MSGTDTPDKKKWNYKAKLADAKQKLAAAQSTASKNLAIARQQVLEKTGKVEQTSENSELTEFCERIEETRMMLKAVYKTAKQGCLTAHHANDEFRNLSKAVAQFGSRTEIDNPDLSKALRKIADVQIRLATLSDTHVAEINGKFTIPLQDFVKRDIRDVRYYKKDVYDKRRVEFDVTLARRKQATARGTALGMTEEEFEKMKIEFDELAHDTLENVREVDERKDVDVLKTMCALVEKQYHYHRQAFDLLDQLQPFVKEMHQRAEEKRVEYLKAREGREKERAEKMRLLEPIPEESRIFGRPLGAVLAKEAGGGTPAPDAVPKVIAQGLQRISKSLDEEGLYRLSGMKSEIEKIKNLIDRNQPWDLMQVADPHAVTGLLKMFLRELPEPLLTFAKFDDFLAKQALPDPADRVAGLRAIVADLPGENKASVKALCHHLYDVKENCAVNKMGPSNLAVVFGPNLLRKANDNYGNYEESLLVNQVVESLIQFAPQIFSGESMPAAPSQPSPATATENMLIDLSTDDGMGGSSQNLVTSSLGGFSVTDDDFNPRGLDTHSDVSF